MDSKQKEKARRIYKTYGLPWEEYQNNLLRGCYICGTKEGRLCVDHIHVKGYKAMTPDKRRKYVRGILCFLCNTGIKGLEKTADGLRNRAMLAGTINYFNEFPLKGEI